MYCITLFYFMPQNSYPHTSPHNMCPVSIELRLIQYFKFLASATQKSFEAHDRASDFDRFDVARFDNQDFSKRRLRLAYLTKVDRPTFTASTSPSPISS